MNENHFNKEEQYSIGLPGIVPLIALADIAYFGVVALFTLSRGNSISAVICGAFALIPSFIILAAYRNYRIRFDSESFTFRSALGKKHLYRYDDIDEIIPAKNHYKIMLKDKTILLNGKGNHSRYFREYAGKKHNVRIKEVASEYKVMRENAFLLIVGIGAILFGTSVSLVVGDFKTKIIMGVFIFLGALLCLARINSSIRYNETEIISRNFLGFEKMHHVAEMTSLSMISQDHIVYFGKERLIVDCLLSGQDQFFDFILKKLEENGRDYMAREKDIFNGHLLFPGQKILTTAILFFVFLGGGLISQYYNNTDASNYENKTVTFSDTAYDDGFLSNLDISRLELYSDDSDIPFLIEGFKEYGSYQKEFFQEILNGTTFYITGYYTSRGYYFFVMQCTDTNGTIFLSRENAKQAEAYSDARFALLFYIIASLIFLIFIGYIILVRHLDQCPIPIVFIALLFGKPSSNLIAKLPPALFEDDDKRKESQKKDKK